MIAKLEPEDMENQVSGPYEHASNLSPGHIRMARAGLELTVRELAVLSGVNKATIVRIEAGYPVRPSTMVTIRDALETRGVFFLVDLTSDSIIVKLAQVD